MLKMLVPSPSRARLLITGLCFLSLQAQAANDFWYWFGDKDIDYFSEGKKIKDPLKSEFRTQNKFDMKKGRLPIRDYDKLPFDWSDYADASSPVFFDEGGDYVPPRPIQMLAANPTPENAERVKQWQMKKMETTMLIAKLLNDDAQIEKRLQNFNWHNVGLYYFYGSTCAACKPEIPVIKELQSLGVQVTPIQVDYQSAPAAYPRSLNYDENMRSGFQISVTPTFVIFGNHKQEQWEGFSTLQDIKSRIAKLFPDRPT